MKAETKTKVDAISCPECNGAGKLKAHRFCPTGEQVRQCFRCLGVGRVSVQMKTWIEQGKQLVKWEAGNKLSMKDAAFFWGTSIWTYSRWRVGQEPIPQRILDQINSDIPATSAPIDDRQFWVALTMALAEANPGTHPESTPNVHAAEIILKSLLGEFQVLRDGRPVDIRRVLESYGSKQDG